jgi:anaerobic selenocysteine-containing dehydrogenase
MRVHTTELHLAWHSLKRKVWTDHVEVHTTCNAGGGNRQLDGQQEGVHGRHPWTTAHLPDMVQGTHSQRGRRVREMQSSPARSTAPELNNGEGGVQWL